MPVDDATLSHLAKLATKAAQHAHCPYSNFHVGAAVLMDDGIYTGCNIENASYGLTVCAERVAIFSAIAAGKTQLHAIAVCCADAQNTPAEPPDAVNLSDGEASLNQRMPCGACRQVIAEFAHAETIIVVVGVGKFTLSQLLPRAFTLK